MFEIFGNQNGNMCHDCFGCEVVNQVGNGEFDPMFSENLHNRLMACCRKHGIDVMAKCKSEIMSPRMTPTHETGLNPVMSHSLTSDDPAAVFQIEEDVHEAIIDTGASRAVIGHERLSGLVKSCGVHGRVFTSPSSVTFRFGNSGILKSTFAVFFSQENGWLDQSGSCARSDSLSTIKLSVESS